VTCSQLPLLLGINSTLNINTNQTSPEYPPLFTIAPALTTATQIVINIDGDLNSSLTPDQHDLIWKGTSNVTDDTNWFAGDAGQTIMDLTYNISESYNSVGHCTINFINANGNRPYPFMSTLNGAFPKLYLNQISNLTVHFDINMQQFSTSNKGWLRTSVVIALQNQANNQRIYFEQDIQDSPRAKAALPIIGGTVAEQYFTAIELNTWVHLDIPFEEFIREQSASTFAKPFFKNPDQTFLESVYLVNECFGNGQVQYSIKNWWITVETNF
jgi:hypothetical protein